MQRLNNMIDKRALKLATNSLIQGQEEERKRISQEIHDGIGQMLTALKLNIENFDGQIFKTSQEVEKYTYTKNLIKETISEVRRISNALAPQGLYDFGLHSVIKQLLEQLLKSSAIKIYFDSNIQHIRYQSNVEITLYRIIQEAINNTIKYANAENLEIRIYETEQFLTLTVFDDGIGFDEEENLKNGKMGNGLRNIKDRTNFIGGFYNILTKPNEGCILKISIPIKNCKL